MPSFNPLDPAFEQRIRDSFQQQTIIKTLGASLTKIEPGLTVIELGHGSHLAQQHGFIHAGVITTIADSSCGYAAYSLMPAQSEVLTVEFKANFTAPAQGDRFEAIGKVVKPGRTLTVCTAEVIAYDKDRAKTIFIMQATMMCVPTKS